MKKILLLFGLFIALTRVAFAGMMEINHFVIKENPFGQDQIAIVATDSLNNTLQNINGEFTFTINGFEDTLKFNSGVAFYKHPIIRSTFIYAKHINDSGTHSILYYVYKGSDKLTVVHISWIVLPAIPLGLILLAYMFKRFIIIAIIILAVFIYFNYHNGLSVPAFFESIINGLRSLF